MTTVLQSTRVKISQNVDTCQGISSALKSQTLCVSQVKMSQPLLTGIGKTSISKTKTKSIVL